MSLRRTMTWSLLFLSNSSHSSAFSDASWADDPDTHCSTTGFNIFLECSLISWRSKGQDIVASSSTEAEYRAMTNTLMDLKRLRDLLSDMSSLIPLHIPLYSDNKSIISITTNLLFNERTKHI